MGWLSDRDDGFAVLAEVRHAKPRIFVIGDINGVQQIPYPFTGNLVKWIGLECSPSPL